MPNYVINNIYLKGPQEDIDKLIALLGKNCDDPEELIDFNNVVKMPVTMNVVEGSVAEDFIATYLKTLSSKEQLAIAENMQNTPARYNKNYLNKYSKAFTKNLTQEENKTLMRSFSNDFNVLNPSSIEEVGKTYIDNIVNYGSDTWYDWSVKNWGTKWNAFDSEIENNILSFRTAWSASLPITKKISEMFPNLSLSHEFADEDMGHNCGRVEFEKGDMVSEYLPEGEEALRYACKLWNCDVTDYGLLPDGVEAMTLEEVIEPYNLGLKVEGNTIVLIDNGKTGSSYDGLSFNIDDKVIGNILEAIDSLTDEAYDEFREVLSKKGFDAYGHGLEGLLVTAPTDTVNYGLMYNICHSDEIMTIKALEEKSLENDISNATKESENVEPKTTEKDDIKEL